MRRFIHFDLESRTPGQKYYLIWKWISLHKCFVHFVFQTLDIVDVNNWSRSKCDIPVPPSENYRHLLFFTELVFIELYRLLSFNICFYITEI